MKYISHQFIEFRFALQSFFFVPFDYFLNPFFILQIWRGIQVFDQIFFLKRTIPSSPSFSFFLFCSFCILSTKKKTELRSSKERSSESSHELLSERSSIRTKHNFQECQEKDSVKLSPHILKSFTLKENPSIDFLSSHEILPLYADWKKRFQDFKNEVGEFSEEKGRIEHTPFMKNFLFRSANIHDGANSIGGISDPNETSFLKQNFSLKEFELTEQDSLQKLKEKREKSQKKNLSELPKEYELFSEQFNWKAALNKLQKTHSTSPSFCIGQNIFLDTQVFSSLSSQNQKRFFHFLKKKKNPDLLEENESIEMTKTIQDELFFHSNKVDLIEVNKNKVQETKSCFKEKDLFHSILGFEGSVENIEFLKTQTNSSLFCYQQKKHPQIHRYSSAYTKKSFYEVKFSSGDFHSLSDILKYFKIQKKEDVEKTFSDTSFFPENFLNCQSYFFFSSSFSEKSQKKNKLEQEFSSVLRYIDVGKKKSEKEVLHTQNLSPSNHYVVKHSGVKSIQMFQKNLKTEKWLKKTQLTSLLQNRLKFLQMQEKNLKNQKQTELRSSKERSSESFQSKEKNSENKTEFLSSPKTDFFSPIFYSFVLETKAFVPLRAPFSVFGGFCFFSLYFSFYKIRRFCSSLLQSLKNQDQDPLSKNAQFSPFQIVFPTQFLPRLQDFHLVGVNSFLFQKNLYSFKIFALICLGIRIFSFFLFQVYAWSQDIRFFYLACFSCFLSYQWNLGSGFLQNIGFHLRKYLKQNKKETFLSGKQQKKKSYLLSGISGIGKSVFFEALVKETNVLGIRSQVSSPKGVKEVLSESRFYKPCIVFLDRLDHIAQKREQSSPKEQRMAEPFFKKNIYNSESVPSCYSNWDKVEIGYKNFLELQKKDLFLKSKKKYLQIQHELCSERNSYFERKEEPGKQNSFQQFSKLTETNKMKNFQISQKDFLFQYFVSSSRGFKNRKQKNSFQKIFRVLNQRKKNNLFSQFLSEHKRNLVFDTKNLDFASKKDSSLETGKKKDIFTSHTSSLLALLVYLENSNESNILLGSTLNAKQLDKAVLRPGRFDQILYFSFPERQDRIQILKLHSASHPFISLSPHISWNFLSHLTKKSLPAHLNLIIESSLLCIYSQAFSTQSIPKKKDLEKRKLQKKRKNGTIYVENKMSGIEIKELASVSIPKEKPLPPQHTMFSFISAILSEKKKI